MLGPTWIPGRAFGVASGIMIRLAKGHVLKAIRIILLTFAIVTSGCNGLTIPDSADISALTDKVSKLPEVTLNVAKFWAANQLIQRACGNKSQYERIAELKCVNNFGQKFTYELLVKDLVECLKQSYEYDYSECLNQAMSAAVNNFGIMSENVSSSYKCEWHFSPGWGIDEVPEKWDPYRTDPEDIARALLQAGALPVWWGAASGAESLLPLLCALGADYGCPDDPNYPGTPQQTSSSGGGER